MPIVSVGFSPLPSHVRTARLIALAVARRAGVEEDLLDEVRLAVGEACSRAVSVHQHRSVDRDVQMRLTDDPDRFIVEVTDCGELRDDPADAGSFDPARIRAALDAPTGDDHLPAGFGLSVIDGLVDDLEVNGGTEGTTVTMTWPSANPSRPEG